MLKPKTSLVSCPPVLIFVLALVLGTAPAAAQVPAPGRPLDQARDRPFGTLREQAAMQQAWLEKRLDTFLPALMRKHGIDMWVVPMREYNEDPVFSALPAPETSRAARPSTCSSTRARPPTSSDRPWTGSGQAPQAVAPW